MDTVPVGDQPRDTQTVPGVCICHCHKAQGELNKQRFLLIGKGCIGKKKKKGKGYFSFRADSQPRKSQSGNSGVEQERARAPGDLCELAGGQGRSHGVVCVKSG